MSRAFLGLLMIAALIVPEWGPYSFDQQDIAQALATPSMKHWFGTDALGRDLFTRIFYGARISLWIGFMSATLAFILGSCLGILGAYFGKLVDSILMKVVDVIAIFPSTLMAILFSLVFGRGVFGILLALTLTTLTAPTRLSRALSLQIKQQEFIQAAWAMGATPWRILLRHLIPNIRQALLSAWILQVSTNMMAEGFLSFLGLGVQSPACSWGTLAHEGVSFLQSYPHLIVFPSLVLLTTSLALQNLEPS